MVTMRTVAVIMPAARSSASTARKATASTRSALLSPPAPR